MERKHKWTHDAIKQDASKYETIKDWRKYSPSAYRASYKYGLYGKIIKETDIKYHKAQIAGKSKKVKLIYAQLDYLSKRESRLTQRRANRHNTLHAKLIQTKRGKLCMLLRATLYQDVKRGKFSPTMKKLLGKDIPVFKTMPRLKLKPERLRYRKDIEKCFHYKNLV